MADLSPINGGGDPTTPENDLNSVSEFFFH